MAVKLIDPAECLAIVLNELGLPSDAEPAAVVAASLRRAASFLAPIAPGPLADAVAGALAGLPLGDLGGREDIEDVLQEVVAHGDLIEAADPKRGRRLLYLGAPAFVEAQDAYFYILGVRPDDAPLVDAAIDSTIEHIGHVRRLRYDAVPKSELIGRGVAELTWAQYLRAPRPLPAAAHLAAADALLAKAPHAGQLTDLHVLDGSRSNRYYRGRWRTTSTGLTGNYVARRPQAFGADLWCFVRLQAGICTAFVDLPTGTTGEFRGCDEAWRLQAALDAISGKPSEILLHPADAGRVRLQVFTPVPRWLQRRWDLNGVPEARGSGGVLSYTFPEGLVEAELEFGRSVMWFVGVESGSVRG